jgi:hypothetical protein
MFGENPTQHITEYHSIFSIMVVAASRYEDKEVFMIKTK